MFQIDESSFSHIKINPQTQVKSNKKLNSEEGLCSFPTPLLKYLIIFWICKTVGYWDT